MQHSHVCREGVQNAVLVTVRQGRDEGVEGVEDDPLGNIFITERLSGLSLGCM